MTSTDIYETKTSTQNSAATTVLKRELRWEIQFFSVLLLFGWEQKFFMIWNFARHCQRMNCLQQLRSLKGDISIFKGVKIPYGGLDRWARFFHNLFFFTSFILDLAAFKVSFLPLDSWLRSLTILSQFRGPPTLPELHSVFRKRIHSHGQKYCTSFFRLH